MSTTKGLFFRKTIDLSDYFLQGRTAQNARRHVWNGHVRRRFSQFTKPHNPSQLRKLPGSTHRRVSGVILLGVGGVSALFGIHTLIIREQGLLLSQEVSAESPVANGGNRFIRLAEVKQHDCSSDRPWVIRAANVYDITDWVEAHPGGEIILKAAGTSIDPYWDIFSMHKKQDVYDILEQYLIGEIHPADLVNGKVPLDSIDDPFVHEPDRDSRLRTLTARPRCAETPTQSLREFLTPNEIFYVRNHMWVPMLKAPEHHLTIELSDGEERTYTLQELKGRFQSHKITATLQCAGNRRKHMTEHVRKTSGLQWTVGAISTAEWEGVRLRDVLADAGVDVTQPDDKRAQHIHFIGDEAYGASIPIEKAVDTRGDVLLAFKMNGKDLPPDHGFPLRTIVPGNVAARSVKWLKKVVVSDEESPSQWQQRDYKCFGPNVTEPDWTQGKAIQEMPVNSAITGISTLVDAKTQRRAVDVTGYAYSGGGREIIRVDVSLDNGKTWDQAELLDDVCKGSSRAWCWKRWRHRKAIEGIGETTFVVKATDEAYNTQPEMHGSIYNPRGNLATAWHRVPYQGSSKEQ